MKSAIHPDYPVATVRCTCGNVFETRSTKPDIHVEICSNCHPFYTGKQKLVDTGGRVERFQRRAAKRAATQDARPRQAPIGSEHRDCQTALTRSATRPSAARPSSRA